jgi:hypothetical protein
MKSILIKFNLAKKILVYMKDEGKNLTMGTIGNLEALCKSLFWACNV